MSAFDQLHSAVQYHIVNSLGWRSLRPLQEQAIEPILGGEHVLLLAPTAGGKTEAAIFPILSRMLAEDWRGLSVLYICPIRALLNNLESRLQRFSSLVGRRTALWHGDVSAGQKARFLAEPGDILLTTPESIEVMLISRNVDHRAVFSNLRVVIVDEIHAFAGDDRGWHLLSLLERLTRLAGRAIQRIGLSATVGNPDVLANWLTASTGASARIVLPVTSDVRDVEIEMDYVGSIANAARVISQIHQGEKRLVFCDSRARVEDLASNLRKAGVETYVSHSSLSLQERRRAETAFAEGTNCVIVATSTLELGIDVGDLDRVIQIDAPSTVASFLQRLGRTGRREGTRRYGLFLATSEGGLLQASGLVHLLSEGYVEPIVPPPEPFHILAQQIMAVALQEGGLSRHRWREWIGKMPGFASLREGLTDAVVEFMVETGILFDEEGMLWLGKEGEQTFGYKNFLELFSVFTTAPLFAVYHGRAHVGDVDAISFQVRATGKPILVLGGQSWQVNHIDWRQRCAYVEPVEGEGRSRWPSGSRSLSFRLCRAIRTVLAGTDPPAHFSKRAREALAEAREPFGWLMEDGTTVLRNPNGTVYWWTFAGYLANAALSQLSSLARSLRRPSDFRIELDSTTDLQRLTGELHELSSDQSRWPKPPLAPRLMEELKFSECLPRDVAGQMVGNRVNDAAGVGAVLAEAVKLLTVSE